jgi:hypothetical protein
MGAYSSTHLTPEEVEELVAQTNCQFTESTPAAVVVDASWTISQSLSLLRLFFLHIAVQSKEIEQLYHRFKKLDRSKPRKHLLAWSAICSHSVDSFRFPAAVLALVAQADQESSADRTFS